MDMNTSKAQEFMLKLSKYAILTPFTVFIIYLLYLSGFSTSVLTKSEHTYLIGDSFWLNVLFAAVLISALLLLYKTSFLKAFIFKVNNDRGFYIKCRSVLLLAYFAALAVYVLASQRLGGVSDRTLVFNVAYQWTYGDYSALYDTTDYSRGYLLYNPHQLGIVVFLYYFSLIFGGHNYAAFELCNALAVVFTYRAFAELSDMSGNSRFMSFSILLICILFLPISLYTTFAYGTLLGLCFAVNAVRHIMPMLGGASGWHKWLHLALSLGEMLLAIAVKKNYLIFAIGYLIFCAVLFIKKHSAQNLIPVIAAVLLVLFSQKSVDLLAVTITGNAVPAGMPTMSWVSMGLGENDNLYDGWWTPQSSVTLLEAGLDSAAARSVEVERVQRRLTEFVSNPEYAIRFFSGKNASQWNNPEFNAYFVNNVPSAVTVPEYLNRFFAVSTMDTVVRILNPMHFAVLAGAVLYLLLKKDKSDVSLFFCVVFVGGFMFHTVWEAKGQYTLPYFTLLLPLAVEGYAEAIYTILDFPHLSKKRRITVISSLAAFIVFGAVICWSNSTLLNDIFVRSEDAESYISYLNDAE